MHSIRKHRWISVEQICHIREQRDAPAFGVAERQGISEAEVDIRPALDVGTEHCPALGVAGGLPARQRVEMPASNIARAKIDGEPPILISRARNTAPVRHAEGHGATDLTSGVAPVRSIVE